MPLLFRALLVGMTWVRIMKFMAFNFWLDFNTPILFLQELGPLPVRGSFWNKIGIYHDP